MLSNWWVSILLIVVPAAPQLIPVEPVDCEPGMKFFTGCGEVICGKDSRYSYYTPSSDTAAGPCRLCWCTDDPHCVTFNRDSYDNFGICQYALTQALDSWTEQPRDDLTTYGIYAEFEDCYPYTGATCVSFTTFYDMDAGITVIFDHLHGIPGMDSIEYQINGGTWEDIATIPISATNNINPSDPAEPIIMYRTEIDPPGAWGPYPGVRIAGNDGLTLEIMKYGFFIFANEGVVNGKIGGLCDPLDPIDPYVSNEGVSSSLANFILSWRSIAPHNTLEVCTEAIPILFVCDEDMAEQWCFENRDNAKLALDHVFLANCIKDCCILQEEYLEMQKQKNDEEQMIAFFIKHAEDEQLGINTDTTV